MTICCCGLSIVWMKWSKNASCEFFPSDEKAEGFPSAPAAGIVGCLVGGDIETTADAIGRGVRPQAKQTVSSDESFWLENKTRDCPTAPSARQVFQGLEQRSSFRGNDWGSKHRHAGRGRRGLRWAYNSNHRSLISSVLRRRGGRDSRSG